MVLIVEAGDMVVGLRLQPSADQPAFRRDPKHRQGIFLPRTGKLGQLPGQRGDENRLAGARQAGDAQPQPLAAQKLGQVGGAVERLLHQIGKEGQSGLRLRENWGTGISQKKSRH